MAALIGFEDWGWFRAYTLECSRFRSMDVRALRCKVGGSTRHPNKIKASLAGGHLPPPPPPPRSETTIWHKVH